MFEGIKMAAKAALIITVTALIVALFANIRIPNADLTTFQMAITNALNIGYHWCPALRVVFPAVLTVFGLFISIQAFHFAAIAIRWVFKVNE